jgi:DNA repair protein RadD
MITLRPYQQEAVNSLYTYFSTHSDPTRNPLIAAPTGSGKSVIIAAFIRSIFESWPDQKIVVLTHVKELIRQNANKMRDVWPQAPLGIYSAGLGAKISNMPITFGGVQSVRRNPDRFGKPDLVIIDEAHLVSPDENASYRLIIDTWRKANPYLRVIGLSATIYRLGLGMLTEGGVFTDVAYDICSRAGFVRLLDEGYLCPLIPMQTKTELDVSNVHKRGGEFIESELQNAVVRYDLTYRALAEAVETATSQGRQAWLIFATGIAHVEMIHAILTQMGINSTFVHSQMTSVERDENLRRFISGEVPVMINANILTTGFDYQALDCIISLRPTSSPVLHVQSLGRGTRPCYASDMPLDTTEQRLAAITASSKQNCLVLDHAGNTRRLGPINDPRIPKKGGEGEGDIPIKTCNACGCLNHISARVCENCGTPFEFKEKIVTQASTLDLIIRDEPQTAWFNVSHITYSPHQKPGAPSSLRVSYKCGLRTFKEWICLEHHGNPIRSKAVDWWRRRIDVPPPDSIEEAIIHVDKLREPRKILVWVNAKYPRVMNYDFGQEGQGK